LVSNFINRYYHNQMAAEIKSLEANVSQFRTTLYSDVYNFPSQSFTGGLTAGVGASVMLSPVPYGVNGGDAYHYLYINDGANSEAVLITGGTAVSGAASGTVQFTPAINHPGAWSLSSASSGIFEAMNTLPANGGTVNIPPGTWNLYQTLYIGNGVGFTTSTKQNITINGSGSGRNAFSPAATDLLWLGPNGGTVVRYNGPTFSGGFGNLRVNGNAKAGILFDIYAVSFANFPLLSLVAGAPGSIGLRIDAGASFNAATENNLFMNLFIDQAQSGANGIQIGPTNLNFNSGNFLNVFINPYILYANDTAASYGLYLGWADNNLFLLGQIQPNLVPGTGTAIKYVRQPAGAALYDFLPSENRFICTPVGNGSSIGISGDAGRGIGSQYWPYQIGDSSGLPNNKGHRGWLANGDFFDCGAVIPRFSFQGALTIRNQTSSPLLRLAGFFSLGSGSIASIGNAVTGVGTTFLSQAAVGKLILANGNELRTIVGITDNTHLTIESGFNEDMPAGSGYFFSASANASIYADSDLNIAVQNAVGINFRTNAATGGLPAARIDQNSNLSAQGRITGSTVMTTAATVGAMAIPAASLINGLWLRTAGGAQTDTTDTAANIIAALPNPQVGMTFDFTVWNASGGVNTLGLGAGVTLAAGITSVLTTNGGFSHKFVFRVSNIGSPAVVVLSRGQVAF
jgi:hypothetical protein